MQGRRSGPPPPPAPSCAAARGGQAAALPANARWWGGGSFRATAATGVVPQERVGRGKAAPAGGIVPGPPMIGTSACETLEVTPETTPATGEDARPPTRGSTNATGPEPLDGGWKFPRIGATGSVTSEMVGARLCPRPPATGGSAWSSDGPPPDGGDGPLPPVTGPTIV